METNQKPKSNLGDMTGSDANAEIDLKEHNKGDGNASAILTETDMKVRNHHSKLLN